MDYRYCRELKHNYLIVKKDNEDDKNSYQMKMFERGKLKSFLPCSMRTINNESFLYYEINSMQSIQDRFSARGMDRQQLMDLFGAMKEAFESLSEYLLGMENVVLDAGSIFVDLVTGQYKFMYSPFARDNNGFACFVDELFLLVDHEDETAVEMVYSCAEKAQTPGFVVMDCIDYVLGIGESDAACDDSDNSYDEACDYEEDPYSFTEEELEDEATCEKRHRGLARKIDGKIQIVFSVLFMALLAAMMYIRMNFILSSGENILSVVVIMLSAVTGFLALLSGIKDMRNGGLHKGQVIETAEEEDEIEDSYFDEWAKSDGEYENKNTYLKSEFGNADRYGNTVKVSNYKNEVKVTPSHKSEYDNGALADCGETTVLDAFDDNDHEMTLYSRNLDKTLRISLGKLPLTLGKMEGCVDKVLKDNSVSRMHCRIFKGEDDRIMLVDLNSTNGTFKNGLRLKAQEGVSIGEGDEIRIGRLCFDCR